MEIITIDGMVEHDFRNSIEDMLRLDQVDQAIERLRALMAPCTGPSEILPPRFLEVSSADVELAGWHRLADRLCDHDRRGHPISAIGVTLADARALGGPGPSRGRLQPFIKTFYFNDDAYPFTNATRDDLLDGYSRNGFEWQGDYQATDATLSIKGIDDVYGAIIELEDRLLDRQNPPEDEIRAGTIGACFVAALIHQALRDTIRTKGLPRPLCVLAACDGVYPFFDAPVVGSDECRAEGPAQTAHVEPLPDELDDLSPADEEEFADDLPGEASLLGLISRKGLKAPVLVLGADDAEEAARYSAIAEAQRLGLDDEQALNGVLEGIHDSQLAEDPANAGGTDWGEPEVLRQRVELEEALALVTQTRSTPPPGIIWPADPQEYPAEQDPWDEDERAAANFPEIPDHRGSWSAPLEDREAWNPEEAEGPLLAPARHSLRARIRLAQPDSGDTFRDRTRAILDRLRRLIFRL